MARAVVDASVVLKWFLREEFSDAARRLRNDFVTGEVDLDAPTLLPYEVMNAARYSRAFSERELLRLAEALEALGLALHPFEGDLVALAVKLATSARTTIYDASYLALADNLGVKFYTADRELLKSAPVRLAEHIEDYGRRG